MPERARDKRRHASAETRLLTLWSHPKVDVITEPHVGVDVPVSEISMTVLGEFDGQRLDVLESVPIGFSGLGVDALVADAGKNACALCQ